MHYTGRLCSIDIPSCEDKMLLFMSPKFMLPTPQSSSPGPFDEVGGGTGETPQAIQAKMTMPERETNSTGDQRVAFRLSYFSFISINGPLIVLNLTANLFFVFCLTTCKRQRVKQPLKILLGSIVFYAIQYLLTVIFGSYAYKWLDSSVVSWTFPILQFMILVNMTSYVWLMFYYYIMIVPSQRALLVWVKKNIKSVIYIVLFFERLLFFGYTSGQITLYLDNSTYFNQSQLVFSLTSFSIVQLYIILCLCLMMFSSFATAHYLNKHMKSLAASGGSPRLRSQIRVTVTGILQGVLYFFYIMWSLVDVMPSTILSMDFSIFYTATCLYILGTTVNLGVGQALFRERAVHVWKAVRKRLCM